MNWMWMVLGVCVQLFVGGVFPKRLGRGLLTKPMWTWPLLRAKSPSAVRLKQLVVLWVIEFTLDMGTGIDDLLLTAGFWFLVIVLYLDDYLFGDDDGKRRWDWVRNKIKWKMELPEPARRRG